MAGLTSQPDEGYSEDPLSGSSAFPGYLFKPREDAVTTLAATRETFPAWLAQHISGLSIADKTELTMAILSDLPTSVVMEIVQQLNPRLYIDFVRHLPPEICLKILGYLDPLSLLNFAKSCKEWYELALDRKLWEHLYEMEGWRARRSEIMAWERKFNAETLLVQSPNPLQRSQSDEDGPPHKKRVVSVAPAEVDSDMIMADADGTIRQEPADMEMTGISLFGDGGSNSNSARTTGISQRMSDLDMRSSNSSAANGRSLDKGKGRETTPAKFLGGTNSTTGLAKSTLAMWDEASKRYRISWKYLYSMRRLLESNWELAKYTNFQFPHPDHPEEGHGECVYTIQYNSDYLVSGSRDRTIKIWDMRTRRCLRTLAQHRGSVLCLQFDSDPQEDILVSGSSDSDVIIWRFSTGEVLKVLDTAHRESVLNLKFDHQILVTSSKDKMLKVFNRKTLRFGDMGYPKDAEPNREGKNMNHIPEPEDYPEIPPWTEIGVLFGHSAAVNTVQIHHNEVVSASGDRHVKVWDWTTQACLRTIVGHHKGIACVLYDGRRIVSGSSDAQIKIFDAQTGLEVACLRSHRELVRTVQAGFGDLPYSKDEDEAEARRVDADYFEAVRSGRIEEPERSTRRPARREANAGSRRPEDICAYGAKLPPGGGGGKYGRIVSGSYDASIIIWRRDKEGVWKDQHRLKQEDAALAARMQVQTSQNASRIALRQPNQVIIPGPHNGALTGAQPPSTAGSSVIQPPPNPMPAALNLQAESSTLDTPGAATLDDIRRIIEEAVTSGQHGFVRALALHPQILAQRHYVETVIDSQSSPVLRSQLRQAFSAALIRAQFEHARNRREAMRAQEDLAAPVPAPAAGSSAGPSNSTSTTTQARPGNTDTATSATARPTPAAAVPVPPQTTAQIAAAAAAHQAHAQLARAPAGGVRLHQVHNPIVLDNLLSDALAQTQIHSPTQTPRPHFAYPFSPDIRQANSCVFKLQFDVRQIIACSQSSVILGWDFCNGDPELEEVCRFFEPVQ
ncbi:F-box/WD repeat-containing protein 1A [Rhypophila sp. PSN 637]